MGFGDYTPPSSGRAKPISKKQLKKLQENFEKADEIAEKARKMEKEEQKKVDKEMESLLDDVFID